MKPLDLAAHLVAQLCVEIGQRLVEQEDPRIAHDGAADGDALALAAGELARIAARARRDARASRRRRSTRSSISVFGILRARSPKPIFFATVICG